MTLLRLVIELLTFIVIFFVPNLVILPFPEHAAMLDSAFIILLFSGAGVIQFFFMCGMVKVGGNVTLGELGIVRPKRGFIFRTTCVTLGICAIYFVLAVVLSFLPAELRNRISEGYQWKLMDVGRMPLIVLLCITVGYREEFLFRAYFLAFFTRIGSPLPVTLFLSAFIFGLLHSYEGIIAMIFAGCAGLFFSWMFVKHRDLHEIAIAHALFNTGLVFLSYFIPV
jgi:membrane protease YdiL (CAAX protease family)